MFDTRFASALVVLASIVVPSRTLTACLVAKLDPSIISDAVSVYPGSSYESHAVSLAVLGPEKQSVSGCAQREALHDALRCSVLMRAVKVDRAWRHAWSANNSLIASQHIA